jgi:hypothetical protein
MIIGAEKSGTTTLAYQLAQHPQVSFCRKKEPHYFSINEDWEANLPEYHQLFSPAQGRRYGEASTSYTYIPEYQNTHARLFAYNPNLKLIYLMRQPVNRIISQYGHDLLQGRAKVPPEIDVLAKPDYLNRSRYGLQIKPYLELFGRENISLLIFEEYISKPIETLAQVASFLDISPEGFTNVDTTPRNIYTPLKKYPLVRFLARSLFRRAPVFLRQTVQNYLLKGQKKIEFPKSLTQKLWHDLDDDICYIEALLNRRLDVWRVS